MSRRPSILPAICCLCAALLLASCEREFEPMAARDAPPPEQPAQAPAIDDTPPPAQRGEDLPGPTIGASRSDATSTGPETPILRAVRTGGHDGFDRLVFEFDQPGLPQWDIEYVDRPVRDCGTGAAVPVAGDAWLQIRFHGAHAHTPQGQPTSGAARQPQHLPNLRELVRICDFEAEVTWVAGVAMPTAYTPRVLEGPSRLVVDIAH